MVVRPYVLAVVAVLPLLAPEVWYGVRLGLFDTVQGVIAGTEQPLSVRSPGGVWAMILALSWFSLAYWHRNVRLWEAGLVVAGGAAALMRTGNLWVDAVLMVPPIGRQLALLNLRPLQMAGLAALSVAVAVGILVQTRPIELSVRGRQAALATTTRGSVLADWRWAPDLQRRVASARNVLAGGGLASESPDFWLDYLRIAFGHERWADLLKGRDVGLVVLDSVDQQRAAADLVRASTDWHVIFDADGALVAERLNP
jgi:hypothetical protein